jgi:parallel beta-helix repeat protein
MTNNTIEGLTDDGIYLNSGDDIKLRNNKITKNKGFSCLTIGGITNSTICCTTTEGGKAGILFGGQAVGINLKNNVIGNHEVGLWGSNPFAVLSQQENGNNQWIGKYSTAAALHEGGNNPPPSNPYQANIDDSRLFIGDPYNPSAPNSLWANDTKAAPLLSQIYKMEELMVLQIGFSLDQTLLQNARMNLYVLSLLLKRILAIVKMTM